jgi:hypothetical protein
VLWDRAHENGDRHDIRKWGQTRCLGRLGTTGWINLGGSGRWLPKNGDRHDAWATGLLTHRTCSSVGLAVESGCGAQIWGQARCPIYRSGTSNVQRSTLNFQWGDRKGAWWAGYGDRHDVWADSVPLAGSTRADRGAGCGFIQAIERVLQLRSTPTNSQVLLRSEFYWPCFPGEKLAVTAHRWDHDLINARLRRRPG